MPSEFSICPSSADPDAPYSLIFFITGNPGLIAYYDTFLSTLHELLSSKVESSSNVFHIHGQNLAGFGDNIADSLYDLEQQIQTLQDRLELFRIPSGPRAGQQYDNIILIGHSVGSYILLEIISRLRQSSKNPTLSVRAGILLFPTVTHIAQSPSGVTFSTLSSIPNFPRIASLLAKALIWPVPREVLRRLVSIVTRMPRAAAEVTTDFLTSRMGVHQALYLAKDEMQKITEDRWDEDIWGIEHNDASSKLEIPKLIFYFGENDHWVADHTRDTLIAARGKTEEQSDSSKPLMLIDKDGVDHGFCIRHSESIAEKVALWIEDIIEAA